MFDVTWYARTLNPKSTSPSMKLLSSNTLAALAALSLCSSASAAIVVANGNGNLESTTVSNLTFYGTGLYDGSFSSVEGWTFSGGTGSTFRWLFGPGAEIYGPILGSYSLNLTQVAANYANTATTSVTGLTIGQTYTLMFDTAVRSGGSGTVTVDVDGTQVGTFDQSVGASYVTKSFNFTATGTSATVDFNYGATVGNNGYMLDNVTVVPEPSAALLGGFGLLALLRRRR